MHLQKLQLENFRNFKELDLEVNPESGITIFLGDNAQGKTNLLESIFLLSFPRSFRTKSPRELINFGQNYYTIKGEFNPRESLKIGYQMKPTRRSYQKNEAEISLKEYLTNFQTVIFTPEDIEIVSGAPSRRRRLMDTIISQTDREYFENLINLTKVLKQRNALLKLLREHKADLDELKYWDSKLINLTLEIVEKRREFFVFLDDKMSDVYHSLASDNTEKVELDYSFPAKSRASHYESYKDALESYLHEEQNQEILAGHTLIGPHRDDFHFKLNGKPVAYFCSRGEKRSFMLMFKIIEMLFLEEKTRHKPLLLLDDVFSELDKNRRHQLMELTKGHQTFITTVEKSYFDDYESPNMQVFNVDNNNLLAYN